MENVRAADKMMNENGINMPNDKQKFPKKGILDPRLMLYGYTTETVNMLLVPMLKTK